MRKDFVYLNVPRLVSSYGDNEYETRRRNHMAIIIQEKLAFFKRNNLLKPGAQAMHVPWDEADVMFSDLEPLGQDFLMSLRVEKWVIALDRRSERNTDAKPDGKDLDKRLAKFLEALKSKAH